MGELTNIQESKNYLQPQLPLGHQYFLILPTGMVTRILIKSFECD